MSVCALVLAVAGVVLRFDDVHPAAEWRDLLDAFDAEGLKASLAVPIGQVADEAQRDFLRRAAANGHEIMDHAPDHTMYSYCCRDKADFDRFRALPFVAETNAALRLIGFRFNFDRSYRGNFAFRGFVTNGVLVVAPDVAKRLRRPNRIYIPSLGRFCGFFDDPGGHIVLRSFYTHRIRETFDVPEGELILCDHRAFSLGDEALRFLAERTREAFRRMGLPDPKVWIQPGGWDPLVPADQLRRIYEREFGYRVADCIPGGNPGQNGDPKATDPDLARFTFRPASYFDSAAVPPSAVREKILKAREEGRGICLLSHTWVPPTMKGGRHEWMDETRALLKWLKENDIPVRTMSEMADHLWGRSWRQWLEVPAKYADFPREVKPTAKYAFPDFDVECYEQRNGTDTVQRVIMAIPRNAKGGCPAVVVPYYFPEAMLGFDPATGAKLEEYAEIAYMSDLARRGYVTASAEAYHLTYDRLNAPTNAWSKWRHCAGKLAGDWPGWTGIGKLTFDTRLLVDLVCADKRVDASRIGIIGHSLGGKMAFYAGCLDPRVRVIVASDFGIGWDQTNWSADWYWGSVLEEVRARGFDNSALLAASGGKPFCLIAGKYDNEDSGRMVRRVRRYESTPSLFRFVNHATGHRPPRWATEEGYRFLDLHLK